MNGKRIGRIEEVRAGEHESVTEFLVGEMALVERLAALGLFKIKKQQKAGLLYPLGPNGLVGSV